MTLARFNVELGSFPGAPGLNVWHMSAGVPPVQWTPATVQDAIAEIAAVYEALKDYMPSGVTATANTQVNIIEETTGDLVDIVIAEDAPYTVTGNASGVTLPRSSSLVMALLTDQFAGGRRLQGRHFLGPLAANAFDADGSLSANAKNDVGAAYAAVISGLGPRLAVWSRPTQAAPSSGSYGDVVQVVGREIPGTIRGRNR